VIDVRTLRPFVAVAFLAAVVSAQDLLVRNARLLPGVRTGGREDRRPHPGRLHFRDREGLKADLSIAVIDAAGAP
jgi:hypothetical protein